MRELIEISALSRILVSSNNKFIGGSMDQEPATGGSNKAVKSIIVIAVIGLIAGGAFFLTQQNKQTANSDSAQSDVSSDTATMHHDMHHSTYKDGTYMAQGSYKSPGGTEKVQVQVTLADDKITDITVTPQAATPTSKQYQGEFVSNYKVLVVGKDIDEVNLSKVAGSSLTSGGFHEALDEIKNEAKA